MSEQLREAFRDLAADAPDIDATTASSSQTWRRARQARRRGLAAVSLAVIAVLLGGVFVAVGLSGVAKPAPAGPVPYDASELAIPNRVWIPSPWTSSTDDAGPLGPLAVIATAPRRTSWFHTESEALFGVSAVDGTYRFIDLPNADDHPWNTQRFALSPDGTEIAYWLLHPGQPSDDSVGSGGVAVYNTVTGRVLTHLTEDRFGIAGEWLGWSADSRTVVFSYGASTGRIDESGPTRTVVWHPGKTGVLQTRDTASMGLPPSPWEDGLALATGSRTVRLLDPATGRTSYLHLAAQATTPGAESPDGQLVAVGTAPNRCCRVNVVGRSASPVIYVARRPADGGRVWSGSRISTHAVSAEVVGWSDDTHVLVSRFAAGSPFQISSVDVTSGQMTRVFSAPGDSDPAPKMVQIFWPSVATGLVDRPFVERAEPASVRDPRLIPCLLLGFAVAVVAIGGFVRVYRRPRRWYLEGNGVLR